MLDLKGDMGLPGLPGTPGVIIGGLDGPQTVVGPPGRDGDKGDKVCIHVHELQGVLCV